MELFNLETKKFVQRKKIRELRQSKDIVELFKKSKDIILKLIELEECKGKKNIMFYVSYGSEVMTFDTINLALITGMRVFVPYIENKDLGISEIFDLSELIVTNYGALEPKKRGAYNKEDIDIVVIPGIAFDERGNRIGSGLGFYDRFLKGCNAIKIALAFDFQILDNIEPTKEDIPVDIIITEKRVIRCMK
jgi:5-formyltetrahydrofolate cyclo-ligase